MEQAGNSTQIEQAAAEWLARREAGEWSANEQAALEAWLAARTEHRVAFLRLQAAWREAGRLQALAAGWHGDGVPPRGHWNRQADSLRRDPALPAPPDLDGLRFAPRKADTPSCWRGIGAAAVACMALAIAGWSGWQLTGREQASYASAIGEIREVQLADGSKATLSSNTRLQVQLSRGQRHIELVQGEAIFDVAHDSRRPFVVEAEGRQAIAVGTRFSVRRDANAVRVVVTEGKVRLDSSPGDDGQPHPAALLPAGSIATVGADSVLVRALPLADAQRLLEWREGFLNFDDTSLAEASAEFNRFNTRKLEIGDEGVGSLRVGGNFRWSNAEGFVALLEQGFPVRAERRADCIVLHSR